MRRQGASIFVYAIFGLLILIFVINFAPSSNRGGLEGGCNPQSNIAVAVDRGGATDTSFRIAYQFPYSQKMTTRQRADLALDELIRRELLAQTATEHGMRSTPEMIGEDIKDMLKAPFYLGGQRIDFTHEFFDEHDGEQFFNYDKYKRWITDTLNVSIGAYDTDQSRGLLAAMMSDLIAGSVVVSREEALADFLYQHDTVTYDTVTFESTKYGAALQLTDADTKRFLDSHAAEVQARYKADEKSYKGRKPELAIREIFIPKAAPETAPPEDDKAKPADDKAKPAEKKPADDKAKPDKAKVADKKPAEDKAKPAGAAKPIGLPIEAAKAKLEAVRAQITAGKLAFVDAEKQLAPEAAESAPAVNGDRGWQTIEKPNLGEKTVEDAAKTLKAGELSPVITTDLGAYLLTATDKREGDLSYDRVKMEIATKLAKDAWGKEAAKREALAALATAQTGKPLDQMFEKAPAKPIFNSDEDMIRQILSDPNVPPEQKQQILQQFLMRKHGSLETHEEDVPVAWLADDGSGQPASAGSTPAPAAPAAAAPAPAAPAAGSAAPAPAAGSAAPAAGSGATSPAPAAAPSPPPAASSDVLPKLGEIAQPKVNRITGAPRQTTMPGIGLSAEASTALFEDLTAGQIAKRLYETETGFALVQLIDHQQPKADEFDKTADTQLAQMREARGQAAVRDWLKSRCEALLGEKKIRAAADHTRETDDNGKLLPSTYRPCRSF